MNQKISAFADEFGTNSFDFDQQGSHFIVATVISRTENLESLREEIENIKKKNGFQTGELKSSGVGTNYKRRIRILNDLAKLDISVYAVIVEKRKLDGKGFNYKKSFYKYLNSLLYKELFRTFPSLDLYVDEHGTNDYMREFKKYVYKNHQRDLFTGSDFRILNSKNNYFIQIADFFAGTLGHIFDENKISEHSSEFYEIIKPKIAGLNFFPKDFSYEELQSSNTDNTFDPQIAEVCYKRAQTFLDKTKPSDQQKTDQINFIRILLIFQRVSFKNRYISTKEIFIHINQNRENKISEEYFRTKVVGNLRDQGVLIASSRNGYKLPTNSKDLDNFLRHGKKIVLPMLHRISEARSVISLATLQKLDILNKDEFKELKDLMDN